MANRIVETVYRLKDMASARLQKIGGALGKSGAQAEKAGRQIDSAANRPSASLKKLGDAIGRVRTTIIGVTAVVAGFTAGLLRAARAADEQERAEALLENTLVKLSGARRDEIEALKAQASALQQTTRFGDEQTIAAQAMLGTFKLNADQIGQLTPLLQDMAEASRKGADGQADLQSVAVAVGKAFSSGIGSLSRYGVALTDAQKAAFQTADQAGRVAIVVEALKENFEGAAQAAGQTFGGQMARARNAVGDFVERIGALVTQSETFRQLADRITKIFGDMASSSTEGGSAVQRAVDGIGRALNGALTALQTGAAFIREYSTALGILAKSFIAVKIGQFVVALGTASAALLANARAAVTASTAYTGATTAAGRFGAALKRLPAGVAIGIALVGVQVAIAGAKRLGEELGRLSIAGELSESQERIREQLRQTGEEAAKQATELAKFRDTQLLTAKQVAALTEEERQAYQNALAGLQEYNKAQFRYLTVQTELGLATDQQVEKLKTVTAQMVATAQAQQSFTQGIKLAADALNNELTPGAQAFVDKLTEIAGQGGNAQRAIADLFNQTLAEGTVTAIGDLGVAIGKLIEDGGKLGKTLREDVIATLAQLTGEQLLEFQSAASAAFSEMADGAAKSAQVMDGVLLAAMQRLGVEAPKLGVAITATGADIIASFRAVAENSRATADQIDAAFQAALRQAQTKEEVEALGHAMRGAAEQGAIGMDTMERAEKRVRDRLTEIANILDPLQEDFRQLGITSKAELDRAAQAAEDSFGRIVQAARDGKAANEDVKNAFIAYAQAQLAATEGASAFEIAQVEAQIKAKAAANGVTSALEELGLAGKKAGDDVAEGADKGKKALDEEAKAAEDAEKALKEKEKSEKDASDATQEHGEQAQNTAISIGNLTEEQRKALDAAIGNALALETLNAQWEREAETLKNDVAPAHDLVISKHERYLELRQQGAALQQAENAALKENIELTNKQTESIQRQQSVAKAGAFNAPPVRVEISNRDTAVDVERAINKALAEERRRGKLSYGR